MAIHERNIHIWVISALYLPNFSGAAIQAHQVIRKLVRRGFSVTVLTAGHYDASPLRGQRICEDGIDIRYLRTLRLKKWASVAEAGAFRKIEHHFKGLMRNLLFGIQTAWTLWREGRPDEIVRIYHPSQFSFLPVWVAKLNGMHSVLDMTLLGSSDDPIAIKKHWNKLLGILTLESFRRTTAITGHSSAQIQSYLSAGLDPRRVFQIPYGVDLRRFRPVNEGERIQVRQKLGLKPDGYFIIFVGDAIARKGLDVLVKAFLQIHSQVKDTELLIVGPCDFNDPAYKLASDLKHELETTDCSLLVHWIGRVDNVHDYMRAADVFCLPTRREGFGIVIIEAMAAGLPVVVSRLEGVTTDIARADRDGILITGHNPDDYAEALLRLLQDKAEAKAMGRAARKRAMSEFNLERIVKRYSQLYRELAGAPGT